MFGLKKERRRILNYREKAGFPIVTLKKKKIVPVLRIYMHAWMHISVRGSVIPLETIFTRE